MEEQNQKREPDWLMRSVSWSGLTGLFNVIVAYVDLLLLGECRNSGESKDFIVEKGKLPFLRRRAVTGPEAER